MWTYNYSDELYHHGIKGQKWGVRRFQNKDGSLTNAGKNRYQNTSSSTGDEFIQRMGRQRYSDQKSGMGIEDISAIAYVSLSVAVPLLMIGKAKREVKREVKKDRKKDMNKLEELNRNKDIKSAKDAPRLSKPMSPSESMKLTNPDFPDDPGTTMNCTFCTTALALREKGFNVVASKSIDPWYADDLFKKTFNAKVIKMPKKTKADDVLNSLSSNGDGAYGNISVTWKMGGGHSLFWKNENGKTHIYDGQSGEEYTSNPKDTKMFMNLIQPNLVQYQRLDNCEPTEYAFAIVEKYKN